MAGLLREMLKGIHAKQIPAEDIGEGETQQCLCLNGHRDESDARPEFVPRLHRNEEYKPGFGQLYIFDSAQATKKEKLGNQSHERCMTEVMQRSDEILR